MGCATSRLDHLPAVSLCRDRCNFLDEALRQSYALADSHVAYLHSLKTLGPTLHRFFDQSLKSTVVDDSTTASVDNPPKKASPLSSPDLSLSSSNSDSHIQFDTDSEEEERDLNRSFSQIHPSYLNHGILTSYALPNHNYHSNTYQTSEFSGSGWKTPPPPAPRSTAWDYLNLFDEIYERYDLPYASSRAVKNKEGATDLEAESVKQKHEDEKSGAKVKKEKGEEKSSGESVPGKNAEAEKKTAESQSEKVEKRTDLSEPKIQSHKHSVSEVMKELQVQFEKASDSGMEALKMLDTGKFRFHHKKSVYQGSSKMFHVITSNSSEKESLLPKEKISNVDDDDEIVSSQNLSSTLRKLCMWEKKLYDEVKAEEKLRLIHIKKCKQIRSLDRKGTGDARRFDSTRTLIRALSTKMRVAVQVIDKIAITVNKLMDEELWPQIDDLIHRLLDMWKVMLECHNCQFQTVIQAKCLDVVALDGKLNDDHLEVAIKLKLELQNWTLTFSSWIEAQRGYVKALNGWIRRCLQYEPEQTAENEAPFSPGRSGVAPVCAIVNQWSEALDSLSEKEVVEAVHALVISINQVLEQHNADLKQRIIADKDMERKLKILEREEQKLQKIMQARAKRTILLTGEESTFLLPKESARGSEFRVANNFQHCLKQIFMAMEKLAAKSRQAYEELHKSIQESKAMQDKPECPERLW